MAWVRWEGSGRTGLRHRRHARTSSRNDEEFRSWGILVRNWIRIWESKLGRIDPHLRRNVQPDFIVHSPQESHSTGIIIIRSYQLSSYQISSYYVFIYIHIIIYIPKCNIIYIRKLICLDVVKSLFFILPTLEDVC